jgi:pyroglutamyl-peptidase
MHHGIMAKQLLLTSFTVWKEHHVTNASDDLVAELLKANPPANFHFLRLVPVDFELAPQQVIAKFDQLQPDIVICCGMAEKRSQLNLEARAVLGHRVRYTKVNLERLSAGLPATTISKDAGRFVCNTLYYRMLHYLQSQYASARCLFVHVPVLTAENRAAIVSDFQTILDRVQQST